MTLAIAACTDGGASAVQTGPLTGGNPDAPVGPPPDGHQGSDDAATGVSCTGSTVDCGPASGYTIGAPQYFSNGNFFVVRDSAGYYALTAVCTHQQATCIVQGTEFFCMRHGAKFTFNGVVTLGPAFLPLVHYGMCDLPNGNLGVMTGMTVPASARLAG